MPHNNSLPATETCPRTRQDVLGRAPPSLEAVSCPLGMSCEQWQYAVSAGWLGMTDTAAARLGYVAPWKLAVSRGQKNGATRLGGTARPPCSRERARNPQTNRWRGAGPDAASCVPAERCGCTSVARAPQPCPEQAVYLSRIVSAHAKVGAGRPIGLVVLRRLSLSGPTREVRTAPNGARAGYGTSRQQNFRTASCRDSSGYGSGLQTLRADRPPNRGAILDEAMRCHASHIEATGDR